MKKDNRIIYGFIIGLINSFLGACGGIICVNALKKAGLTQKEAQANAIAVILPLSIISSAMYLYKGDTDFLSALIYIPGCILGSFVGSEILPKINNSILKKIFAGFIIWAGIRMITR